MKFKVRKLSLLALSSVFSKSTRFWKKDSWSFYHVFSLSYMSWRLETQRTPSQKKQDLGDFVVELKPNSCRIVFEMQFTQPSPGLNSGQDSDKSWPKPGQVLAKAWPKLGQRLVKFWPIPDQSLTQTQPKPNQNLPQTRPNPGLNLGLNPGQNPGQNLDQNLA